MHDANMERMETFFKVKNRTCYVSILIASNPEGEFSRFALLCSWHELQIHQDHDQDRKSNQEARWTMSFVHKYALKKEKGPD